MSTAEKAWEEYSSHFPKVYMSRTVNEQRKADFMAGFEAKTSAVVGILRQRNEPKCPDHEMLRGFGTHPVSIDECFEPSVNLLYGTKGD